MSTSAPLPWTAPFAVAFARTAAAAHSLRHSILALRRKHCSISSSLPLVEHQSKAPSAARTAAKCTTSRRQGAPLLGSSRDPQATLSAQRAAQRLRGTPPWRHASRPRTRSAAQHGICVARSPLRPGVLCAKAPPRPTARPGQSTDAERRRTRLCDRCRVQAARPQTRRTLSCTRGCTERGETGQRGVPRGDGSALCTMRAVLKHLLPSSAARRRAASPFRPSADSSVRAQPSGVWRPASQAGQPGGGGATLCSDAPWLSGSSHGDMPSAASRSSASGGRSFGGSIATSAARRDDEHSHSR